MATTTQPPQTQTRIRTLYFAYGSNLSLTQMKSRCPTSTYHALGVLRGWKWIIGTRGYANVIVGDEEDVVYGMLYWLEKRDEEELDLAEGVPYAYGKRELGVVVLGLEGKEGKEKAGEEVVKALVYVDERRTEEGEIREEYVRRMNRGIRDAVAAGMPREYVEKVLRKWVKDEGGDDEGEVEDPFHPEKMR